jgi:DNA-binding protein HU-beta
MSAYDLMFSNCQKILGGVLMAGKAMTKAQLISLIAEKAEITKVSAGNILDIISTTAVTETKKNGQFIIPGIGKLVKSQNKARMGRNPQTGDAIKIPAKTVVKFRVAKACKDAVVPEKKKK